MINGVFPAAEAVARCAGTGIFEREQAALATLPDALRALPTDQIELKPFNLVGLAALRQLLAAAEPAVRRQRTCSLARPYQRAQPGHTGR